MACAYAKWTGRLCVRLATSGPGGIHLLNGPYDAKHDGKPLLAITGLQFHDLIDTHTQQDVELDKRVADVCVYNTRIMTRLMWRALSRCPAARQWPTEAPPTSPWRLTFSRNRRGPTVAQNAMFRAMSRV